MVLLLPHQRVSVLLAEEAGNPAVACGPWRSRSGASASDPPAWPPPPRWSGPSRGTSCPSF